MRVTTDTRHYYESRTIGDNGVGNGSLDLDGTRISFLMGRWYYNKWQTC